MKYFLLHAIFMVSPINSDDPEDIRSTHMESLIEDIDLESAKKIFECHIKASYNPEEEILELRISNRTIHLKKEQMVNKQIFNIHWNKAIPNSNVDPASDAEIIKAMETINERAERTRPGDVICVKLRTEVAEAVREGIIAAGSGAAIVDIGEDKTFKVSQGIYISHIYVAKDKVILTNYIDGF